ncbi:hypothetical protein FAP59_18255, partial [Morganella morganii]|nr:hypothetical protein [Morganella morganii]
TLLSTTKAVSGITVSAGTGSTPVVNADKVVSFTADSAAARVSRVTLTDAETGKVANGENLFTYTAQVEDGNGNPVPGVTVNWSQDKGADVTLPATGVTNEAGQITVTLLSTTKAVSGITVSAGTGSTPVVNADKVVSFTADSAAARVSRVTLTDAETGKVANGENLFTYTAQVEDGNGNPVPGVTVNWSQDKGADVTLPATGVTDEAGQITVTLLSTTKAVSGITVSAGTGSTPVVNADKVVSFTADISTAVVNLVTVPEFGSFAVSSSVTHEVSASLVDKYNNPITQPGIEIQWIVDNSDVVLSEGGVSQTSDEGIAKIKISSNNSVKNATISAKVKTSEQIAVNGNYTLSFLPDFILEVTNGVNLPASNLLAAFQENRNITINNRDRVWSPYITLPEASLAVGKVLNVNHVASCGSKLIVDGTVENLCRSNTYTLVSDGNKWNFINRPSHSLNCMMCR